MSPSTNSKRSRKLMDRPISPPPLSRSSKSTTAQVTTSTTTSTYKLSLHAHPHQPIHWHRPYHTLLVCHYTPVPHTASVSSPSKLHPDLTTPLKIAAFDLDHTLILTSSGRIHAQDSTDWRFLSPTISSTLRSLSTSNYNLIIFTNQGGLSPAHEPMWRAKLTSILQALDVPISVYIARGDDRYRKPRTGMWGAMLSDHDGGRGVDWEESFYVGDAAGREGDHSDCDRGFAEAVGIRFLTPEEYFLGQKPVREDVVSGGEDEGDKPECETDQSKTEGNRTGKTKIEAEGAGGGA